MGDRGGGVQSQALSRGYVRVSATIPNEGGASLFEKWHETPCSLNGIQPFGTVGYTRLGEKCVNVGHGPQQPDRDVQSEEP